MFWINFFKPCYFTNNLIIKRKNCGIRVYWALEVFVALAHLSNDECGLTMSSRSVIVHKSVAVYGSKFWVVAYESTKIKEKTRRGSLSTTVLGTYATLTNQGYPNKSYSPSGGGRKLRQISSPLRLAKQFCADNSSKHLILDSNWRHLIFTAIKTAVINFEEQ